MTVQWSGARHAREHMLHAVEGQHSTAYLQVRCPRSCRAWSQSRMRPGWCGSAAEPCRSCAQPCNISTTACMHLCRSCLARSWCETLPAQELCQCLTVTSPAADMSRTFDSPQGLCLCLIYQLAAVIVALALINGKSGRLSGFFLALVYALIEGAQFKLVGQQGAGQGRA
jgi:hypothetical protein